MKFPFISWISWGWCAGACVVCEVSCFHIHIEIPWSCCLLTFLGRRLQSESCLLAAIVLWWNLKGSQWSSLVDLNWDIRSWRNKLNVRKKILRWGALKLITHLFNCALKLTVATRECRASLLVEPLLFFSSKREINYPFLSEKRLQACHSSAKICLLMKALPEVPQSYDDRVIPHCNLCCPAFTTASKRHTHSESQAKQDCCIL